MFSQDADAEKYDGLINKNFIISNRVNLATFTYNFTNYQTKGELHKNQYEIIIGENNKKLKTDLLVSTNIICNNKNNDNTTKVDGVIGLGFFNNLGEILYDDANFKIKQNILTYSLNGNEIQLSFGKIDDEEKKYINKLTSCNVILNSETDIQAKKMTCQLNGMKSSKHKDAFSLGDAYITFSINEKNNFIIKGGQNAKKYLENEYFDKGSLKFENGFYYYDVEKINKLYNFGFVFNNYYYSYEPTFFFDNKIENGKKKFLIEFNDKAEKTEFILGKTFLDDAKFTINNEEAVIYFYTKRAEYFNGNITELKDDDTSLN